MSEPSDCQSSRCDQVRSERDMFRRALEIIAGIRVNHDNLMGNVDIAREALTTRFGETK
jgi:hypothetical protein